MSRIGKKTIPIPQNVKVEIKDSKIVIEGPKGKIEQNIHPRTKVIYDKSKNEIRVERQSDERQDKMLHGTMRSLINNAIIGTTQGYEKKLEIIGIGYNAKVESKELVLQVGLTHPVRMKIPDGVFVVCPSSTLITVQGADKQKVGQFSIKIKKAKPPDPYKVKGIKFVGEVIRKKAGKTFVSGA